MLAFLRDREKEHEKRLRRFAIGCCQHAWNLMPENGISLIIEAEHFSEGIITRYQRDCAVAAFRAVYGHFGADTPILRAAYRCKNIPIDVYTANIIASDIAVAVGKAADPKPRSTSYATAYNAERVAQATLFRCIF